MNKSKTIIISLYIISIGLSCNAARQSIHVPTDNNKFNETEFTISEICSDTKKEINSLEDFLSLNIDINFKNDDIKRLQELQEVNNLCLLFFSFKKIYINNNTNEDLDETQITKSMSALKEIIQKMRNLFHNPQKSIYNKNTSNILKQLIWDLEISYNEEVSEYKKYQEEQSKLHKENLQKRMQLKKEYYKKVRPILENIAKILQKEPLKTINITNK